VRTVPFADPGFLDIDRQWLVGWALRLDRVRGRAEWRIGRSVMVQDSRLGKPMDAKRRRYSWKDLARKRA
jgi:hypothetical protein